jgi:histidinol dehydrogenase
MRILTPAQYLRQVQAVAAGNPRADVADAVERILASVRDRGDDAVREWTRTLDGVDRTRPRVDAKDLARAWDRLPPELQRALRLSKAHLERYQRSLRPRTTRTRVTAGITLTTEWVPLRRVGAYAPGGRASYPSTVLMTCVPARVAGVDEICLASPPGRDGRPSGLVLAAAHLAGVDAVYAVGGAQALAAFAYGTESIPRVDKIVGPGNAYVAEAKRRLQGVVGTDAIAGPSELAVWADPRTDPELVALDLLAQAEHDPEARALVVTTDVAYARRLQTLVEERVATAQRRSVLETSLGRDGLIVVADSPQQVPELLDASAAEHVELLGAGAARIAARLRAAGTIFEGPLASASLGDYTTGADHVLPTARTARWANPLSVYDFLRQRVRQRVDRSGLARAGAAAVAIAEAEGLPNHAEAVRRRLGA